MTGGLRLYKGWAQHKSMNKLFQPGNYFIKYEKALKYDSI